VSADVLVHRCTLTIRRRDGWSWGAGAGPHVEAALAGIEAALEAAIEEAGIDAAADVRLELPVRLRIDGAGGVTADSWNALVERLRALPAESAQRAGGPQPPDTPPAGAAGGDGAAAAALGTQLAPERAAGALARTLARWSRGGRIAALVSAWPAELVRDWLDAIAVAAGRPGEESAPASLRAAAVALIAEGTLGSAPADAPARADDRLLILLAAIAAALGERLPDAATQALAAECVLTGDDRASGWPRARAARDVDPNRLPVLDGGRPASAPRRPTEQVVPALAFLVLAQLARIGYVDAIAAAAAAAGLPSGAGALAAALAGKVLAPPARGWSREPAQAAAVALASGGPVELVPDALAAIAACEQALVAPLAATLQAAYAEGRSARDELLEWAGEEGIVCGEERGLLPIAWVQTDSERRAVLASLGDPPVRRNGAFGALARTLHERRGLPRADAPALERQLGAAAGTALGLIALNLWDAAGETTPLLALERLEDLEARVRPRDDGLFVAIPRGQRWLDLRRGGLLEPFAVPWLAAGRLEIGTW
jgi:hypothetical protein